MYWTYEKDGALADLECRTWEEARDSAGAKLRAFDDADTSAHEIELVRFSYDAESEMVVHERRADMAA